jgi:hypothetical protein
MGENFGSPRNEAQKAGSKTMPNDSGNGGSSHTDPESVEALNTQQFTEALNDAEVLLAYAASNGLLPPTKPGDMVEGIVLARQARRITAQIAIGFWVAYANLSKLTRPVTAASVRACMTASLLREKIGAFLLVCFVILFSIFLFMNNQTAADTQALIEQQNAAALKLWDGLQMIKPDVADGASRLPPSAAGAPGRVFQDTVEFSRRNQWLLQSAIKLHYWFNHPWADYKTDRVTFNKEKLSQQNESEKVDHLLVPPDISTPDEIAKEAVNQIKAYQLLRDYAQYLYTMDSIVYGGITTYFLPTIYALLGAYLYGFRLYSRLMRRGSYRRSAAHSARYFIAAIAGLVVGLFGSLLPKSLALSPLAVAFLVGYAVEAFFSWLDGLIRKLKDASGAEPSAAQDEGVAD